MMMLMLMMDDNDDDDYNNNDGNDDDDAIDADDTESRNSGWLVDWLVGLKKTYFAPKSVLDCALCIGAERTSRTTHLSQVVTKGQLSNSV